MSNELSGRKIAILATDGFEKSELFDPKKALDKAGAETKVVSLKSGRIKGWSKGNWDDSIAVDLTLDQANPDNFDALLIPGGVINPDKMRLDPRAVTFAKSFFDAGKPVAAICHGPQLLIETKEVRGKRMTSWPSLKTDLLNAGAIWEDSEVVSDKGLTTSRKPEDIPAFSKKIIEEFAFHGQHRPRAQEEARPH